jgi:hypothetical protein
MALKAMRFRRFATAVIDPKLDQIFTADGQTHARKRHQNWNGQSSAFAFVGDGRNGLRVCKLAKANGNTTEERNIYLGGYSMKR